MANPLLLAQDWLTHPLMKVEITFKHGFFWLLLLFFLQHHVESHTSSEDSDDAMKNNSVLVIAIHIYLTSGIIMFQGTGYTLWAQKEFPELKKLVDLSCNNVTQPDGSIPRVEQINFEQTEHLLKTLNDAENLLPGKTKGTKKKSNHQSVIPEKPRAAGLTQVL